MEEELGWNNRCESAVVYNMKSYLKMVQQISNLQVEKRMLGLLAESNKLLLPTS